MTDRAINMPLRVTGIGEVERDFKRVGDAGGKGFDQVAKSANGAAREVSEYHARLKRAAAEANRQMRGTPELFKGSVADQRANQRDFRLGFINAEKDRIRGGLPDLTRNYGQAAAAGDAFGLSLTRVSALAAGAGTAIYALGQFVMDSVGAFAEHERALASFDARLALTGNRSSVTGEEIKAMAEKVVEATGQTEKAALSAAQTLAGVPGITREGLEAALDAASRLADALGEDVSKTAADTAKVLTALADKDMKALWKATEDVNDVLRVQVVRLAEAGKTAEAQKVYIEALAKAAGDGPDGLTRATDKANDSWTRLKEKFGETIAPTATVFFNSLSGLLDAASGKTDNFAARWALMAAKLANPITLGSGVREVFGAAFGMDSLPTGTTGGGGGWGSGAGASTGSGLLSTIDRAAQAAANATARGQVKALDDKYGSGAKTAAGNTAALGDAVALVKQLFPGATITATTGGKHTKGSDHYAGRAIDFVPAGGMGQYTTAQVERMLEGAGVDIRRNAKGTKQIFGPGRSADKPGDHNDHFHFAFNGSPSPEDAQKRAARVAEQAVERQAAFIQEAARLDAEQLRSKMALVGDGAEMARIAAEQLKVENAKYAASLDEKVRDGQLNAADAQALKLKAAENLALEQRIEARVEENRKLQEAFADQLAANDNQRDLLVAQEGIADTVAERKKLALALLKLDQDEERERLRTVIAAGKLADATEGQRKAAERAQARLDGLPAIQDAQRRGVERQNQTSLERFIADTDPKHTEDRVNELVYDELMSVRSGIRSAIGEALGTDDPLITGLLDMLLDQVLFRPLAQILSQAQSSGGGLGGLIGGLIGGIGGGLAPGLSAAGAAKLAPGVNSMIASMPGIFAAGTPSLPTGRDFYVGENGRELMRYHGGGRLEVISGPQAHREAVGGNNLTINQTIQIPARVDPRRTMSGVHRANMRSMAEASRKGLAAPGRR